jgi:Lon protease-like protein
MTGAQLMLELPLFPLNSVLFPGMLINLHIFEERYKQMIGLCLKTRQPFGVVLIAEGKEVYGVAKPHLIGCTAHIARVQPLEQGRMDITAIGQERFEILTLQSDRSYLVGDVNMLPLERGTPEALTEAAERLRPWVMRYIDILAHVENIRFKMPKPPADPVAFGYLAASVLHQVPLIKKQELLAVNHARELLAKVRALYELEVSLLEMMAERADHADTDFLNTSFSTN